MRTPTVFSTVLSRPPEKHIADHANPRPVPVEVIGLRMLVTSVQRFDRCDALHEQVPPGPFVAAPLEQTAAPICYSEGTSESSQSLTGPLSS